MNWCFLGIQKSSTHESHSFERKSKLKMTDEIGFSAHFIHPSALHFAKCNNVRRDF